MNRIDQLSPEQQVTFNKMLETHLALDEGFLANFNRSLPFNETLVDRWERAKRLNFGENSSVYDSAFVFNEVKVGAGCWIGPYTIIDGSGGLEIGDFCTVSVGVHIYTHDNIKSTLTSGKKPIEKSPVKIGSNVYIGPNSIITRGVTIGSRVVIGAGSFINKDVADNTIVVGQPAREIGKVVFNGDDVTFEYFNK